MEEEEFFAEETYDVSEEDLLTLSDEDAFDVELPTSESFDYTNFTALELKASLPDFSSDEIQAALESGFLTSLREQARYNILKDEEVRLRASVEKSLLNEETLDEDDLFAKYGVLRSIETSSAPELAKMLKAENEDGTDLYSPYEKRRLMRMQILNKVFLERRKESSDGSLAGVGYFLDFAASDVFSGGGFKRSNVTEKINRLILDTSITDEEFEEQVRGILTDYSDAGWFSSNNFMFTDALMERFEKPESRALDQLFTLVDVVFVTEGAAAFAKSLTAARRTTDVATLVLKPNEVKEEALKKVATKGDTTDVEAAMITTPTASTTTGEPRAFYSAPVNDVMVDLELRNRLLQRLDKRDYGGFIEDDVWEAKKADLLADAEARIKATANRGLVDFGTEIRLGNPIAYGIFGNTRGKFWQASFKHHAKNFANKIGGTVEKTVQNGKEVFYVRKEVNIATKGLVKPTSEDELRHVWLSWITSPKVTTSMRLDGMLLRGEGQKTLANAEVANEWRKVKKAAGKDTVKFVDELYGELRDGVESFRRGPLSTAEFKSRFYNKFSRAATDKEIEYYTFVTEVNDTAYYFAADPLFKDAVNKGFRIVRFGEDGEIMVRPIVDDDIPTNGLKVWSFDDGKEITVNKGAKGVYQANEPHIANGISYKYVSTSSNRTRRIYHTDVLPYNVGGPRITPEHKHFVTQPRKYRDANLGVVKGKDHTLLAAYTEKEASKARFEINTLLRGIRSRVASNMTIDQVAQTIRNLGTDVSFREFVAQNTLWNTRITNVDDLADFVLNHKIDVFEDVGVKARNSLVEDAGTDYILGQKSNFVDLGTDTLVRSMSRKRLDAPVLGYGGEAGQALPFSQAVERNFTSHLTQVAEASYMNNAVRGWLTGAGNKNVIENLSQLSNMSPLDQLRHARVNQSTGVGRKFELERQTILRRAHYLDAFTKHWKQVVTAVGDWVYDAGYKRSGKWFQDQFSDNPLNALRALSFNLKLGFFNPAQLLVQSSQAVNIMAVGGVNGFLGTALAWPIRLAVFNGTSSVSKEIGRRLARVTGMSAADFDEMMTFIKESGRHIVGHEVAERDQALHFLTNTRDRIAQHGRVFFNEGERFARMAAAGTAYLDFKKMFPKGDIFSQTGKNWMANRMDVLTASMTTASRTPWQANTVLAVPLQFMSFTSRMLEQLFTPNILTKAERIRLAAAQTLFWGTTGAGMTWALDWVAKDVLPDMDPETYKALRFGAVDFLVGQAFDAETAWANRLAFGTGLVDFFEKITEDDFTEIIGGPAASTAYDITASLYKGMADMWHGRTELAKYDFGRLTTTLSTVSSFTRSYYVFRTGEYFSRRGDLVVGGLTKAEGVWHALGAPLQVVDLTYDQLADNKKRLQALKEIGREITRYQVKAMRRASEGDYEGAASLIRDAGALMTSLPVQDQLVIQRSIKPRFASLLETVTRQTLKLHGVEGFEELKRKFNERSR